MYAKSGCQVIWSPHILVDINIPDSTKDFLSTIGFPPLIEDMGVEFAVFDSDPEIFMIGVDGDDCVFVNPEGRVLIERVDGEIIYVNSSVENLSIFIHKITQFRKGKSTNMEDFLREFNQLMNEFKNIDQDAMIEDVRHVWPPLLADIAAMAWF